MKRLQLNRESKYKRVKRSSQRVAGKRAAAGFTLIELLIVIVVIAILAAVSVVAYRGISNRASDTAVQSDLAQMYKSYGMSSIDEGSTFHSIKDEHSDWSSHEEEIGGRYFTPITSPGQDEFKQLLGLTPDRPYYYNKGDDISVVYIMEYTDYYDPNTDTYRYKNTPVFYARSASGKVFRHDGRITQDFGSASSLLDLLPGCDSAYVFLQSKSKWYYYAAYC